MRSVSDPMCSVVFPLEVVAFSLLACMGGAAVEVVPLCRGDSSDSDLERLGLPRLFDDEGCASSPGGSGGQGTRTRARLVSHYSLRRVLPRDVAVASRLAFARSGQVAFSMRGAPIASLGGLRTDASADRARDLECRPIVV